VNKNTASKDSALLTELHDSIFADFISYSLLQLLWNIYAEFPDTPEIMYLVSWGHYFHKDETCLWHSDVIAVCINSNISLCRPIYVLNSTNQLKATQTHCYNPVAPAYPIWAYYVYGRQRRCQADPVSLPSGRLEKTTRSSPHHVAQHCPTGSETTSPYAPRSSRFGSEPPSMEDDVDVWRSQS